jgi:hypothetical protein
MNALVRTMIALAGLVAAEVIAAAETKHVRYDQHYAQPKPRWFADGDVVISHPKVGDPISAAAKVELSMVGHPQGDAMEWTMAKTSTWQLATSVDGGAWGVTNPVTPTNWTANPSGTFEVTLPLALPPSAGTHKMDLEIYGQCADCRTAIIPPDGTTNWKIPARLTWETDGTGHVTAFQVQFFAPDQSHGIDGFDPYFPPRQPGTYAAFRSLAPAPSCGPDISSGCVPCNYSPRTPPRFRRHLLGCGCRPR